MLAKLKENKAFQTVVGALVLYVTFRLWREGWIDWLLGGNDAEEGFSNSGVWLAVGAAVLNFVQMVGILAIGVIGGILPHVDDFLIMVTGWIKKGTQSLKDLAGKWKNSEKKEGQFNWKPAIAAVIAWFAWSGGLIGDIKDIVIDNIPNIIIDEVSPEGKPVAVLFSMAETATAKQNLISLSGRVDQAFLERGIERRRLLATQAPANAEPWVAQAVAAAPDDECCLVLVMGSGVTKVIPIPETVDDTIDLIVSWD